MPSKKSQRRFTSEREILAEIYSCQRKLNAQLKEAEEKEAQGHKYVRTGEPGLVSQGQMDLKDAERLRKLIKRTEDNKLKKLKNALSAFQTEMLPGMGGDKAVVLENLK